MLSGFYLAFRGKAHLYGGKGATYACKKQVSPDDILVTIDSTELPRNCCTRCMRSIVEERVALDRIQKHNDETRVFNGSTT